jgi:hypothetical protein
MCIALALLNFFLVSTALLGYGDLWNFTFLTFWLICILAAFKTKLRWIAYLGQTPISILLIYRITQSTLGDFAGQSAASFIVSSSTICIGYFLTWIIARSIHTTPK